MAIDCTTIARVKAHLPGTDAGSDAVLALLISSVSARMEAECYRWFQSTERTEVYPLRQPARLITLKGSPVTATDSRGVSLASFTVKASSSLSFSASPTLTRNTDYLLEQDRGVLRMLTDLDTFTGGLRTRPIAPAYVQVLYTGGLAADTTAFVAAYPDLAIACEMQVVHEFRRRTNAGAGDAQAGDSSFTHSADLALLTTVREALRPYKRRRG